MNFQIAMLLGQDGMTNGAIYALLALSILLVFTVTRILLIPLGEFVTYGALTMATLQNGHPTALVWLLLGLTLIDCALDLWGAARASLRLAVRILFKLGYAGLLAVLINTLPLAELPMAVQALLTLALVVPLGPQIYRLVFQPIASASSLVLLIVSIAVHVSMTGMALLLYGPEGARTRPFSEAGLELGPVTFNSQTLWVLTVSLGLIVGLYLFFERTLYGKALRATAINRMGARLMGISPTLAGKSTFLLAALIGTLSGILIAPITTLYFDSGFVISLKGFVGAIIGGLVSYPVAALGALAVGLIEAFSMFWASTYKEIIVFTLIIPFLLWRSFTRRHVEEEE
ncbi:MULTISPECIES: branched-chain amino acid ABC transporter permease [Pseudomonas]|jgi:branched-chain amino acid transport system permease protein|uniref:Branched-chain amino acid ABC transporter permease n=1 Tax=Pseudomonas chlororaphis TaxID=587753 RepID=A0AB34CAM4_9PSED|nr:MULTISPECIES: branched-chain amino acid ABC transporter permease [Pseudomonas]AUG01900.1 branched-chain amino acid ABC transporter permease [Pseudomonas sp. 09C 129]AZD01916.1 High-affinity branched-chain amino acid transport system permease protein LivH [Pseudomonas chlororaphis subsp. chlororaphis]KAA5842442.1 branched-chain amino acid ABC transporter permease [Pseudomonas chlororaphis]MBM0283100.1 branched-chain amino acid ABC transporter permease [Pseudomonas chlororaphis]MDO1507171.1 b